MSTNEQVTKSFGKVIEDAQDVNITIEEKVTQEIEISGANNTQCQ